MIQNVFVNLSNQKPRRRKGKKYLPREPPTNLPTPWKFQGNRSAPLTRSSFQTETVSSDATQTRRLKVPARSKNEVGGRNHARSCGVSSCTAARRFRFLVARSRSLPPPREQGSRTKRRRRGSPVALLGRRS